MPHCIIEYSDGFSAEDLVHAVHEGAMRSRLFTEDGADIKVRATSFKDYLVGNKRTEFVHVVLKILSGRTEAQKKHLSNQVLAQLKDLQLKCGSLTVEVVEIDRFCYAKHTEKT